VRRNPGLLYGLGNLVENAVDFARSRVEIAAIWDAERVEITIRDDGPGFSHEMLARIGDPYVTSRPGRRIGTDEDSGDTGLGLGLFIAKTLLERSGASVRVANRGGRESGALVTVAWARPAFEATA